MLIRISRAAALGCAYAAVSFWALALTLLQPLTETAGRYSAPPQYWARDLRWLCMLAAGCALVVALHPAGRPGGPVAALGPVLLAADLGLDRAGVAGPAPAVLLAVAACALVTGVRLAARRRPGGSGYPAALACAAIAAAGTPLAPFVAASPVTAGHPALRPAVVAVTVLFATVTIVAVVAVAGAARPGRLPLAALVVSTAACAIVPAELPVLSALGAAVLTAATAVMLRTGPLAAAAHLAALLAGYPAAVVALRMVTRPLAAIAGGLAGAAPRPSAGDVLFVPMIALLTGMVYGGVLLLARPFPPGSDTAGDRAGWCRAPSRLVGSTTGPDE